MLKIYIGDTEVVSSNEISIKEEFLNPSSVILNNVMPKSWEDERNYTGFYHFKDYDKCRILDIIDHEEIEGTTVEGTSLSIDYNNEYDFEYKLLGQTEQDGTPTPDSPIPVNVVTGDNTITICGKNLLNNTNYSLGGISFDDGSDTTATDSYRFNDYTPIGSNITFYLLKRLVTFYYDENKNLIGSSTSQNLSKTTPSGTYYVRFRTFLGDFATFNSSDYMVSLSEITSYEAYQGQSYPISLGDIELCKIGNYQDYIYYSDGNWYKKEYIGKIVLDGSESWVLSSTNNFFYHNDSTIIQSSSGSAIANGFSNSYNATSYNNIFDAAVDYGFSFSYQQNRVVFRNKNISNVNDWKTELSQNNVTLWYQRSAYVDTQITDTTLINQLNDIALSNGTNNIVITGDDLPPIMNLHYNFKEAYTEENLLFCGVVKNSGNISLNPRYPHFSSLQVIDFKTFLSEGESLDFVISNKTVTEAINQVISAISDYGFVLGNIQIFGADDVIGAYNCENKTAYDVFQYLSEITGSRWFTRMIDQNTVAIDFYDPTLMTSGQNIEYTQEWFENNNVEDLSYNYGTYDYRNKQIMESDKVFASIDYTENIVADGYAKIFQTSTSIGVIKSITAGGVSKTFATNSDKELGVEADFYYTPNEVNLETDVTYSAGTVITIVYTPLVKGRRVIRNYDEITRIAGQTNRRGTIARYETRNDVTDGSELEKIGETYLKYKGSPEINLKLVVRDNDIYSIGQTMYFDAPLEDLQTEYLLKKKTTNIITDNNQFIYQYVYEFTSSFNVENEVNYFDNQRNKAKGNISEGEYIIRDVDIDEQANIIFHNLTISEVTVNDDNILEAILESPLTK